MKQNFAPISDVARRAFECTLLIATTMLGANCLPADEPETNRPAPEAPVISECAVDGPECPLNVPCVDGRCFSGGALCALERDCGANYDCVDGRCRSNPGTCGDGEPACCTDTECQSFQVCEAFACVNPICDEDRDCELFYGLLNRQCESSDECGVGGGCLAVEPPTCVNIAGTCCDDPNTNDGCRTFPLLGVDATVIGCTMPGQCIEARCVWANLPPDGGVQL